MADTAEIAEENGSETTQYEDNQNGAQDNSPSRTPPTPVVTETQTRAVNSVREEGAGAAEDSNNNNDNDQNEIQNTSSIGDSQDVPTLEKDIIEIIGEEPGDAELKVELSSHITSRWGVWLKTKMTKEEKDKLLKKYPRAGECGLEAPKLNPEVAASMKEVATKRDMYYRNTQNLAGSALSALGLVIEPLLLKQDVDRNKTLEKLWEASQLIAELHRSQTYARRSCITSGLDKTYTELLEKAQVDTFLFGEKLGDKIKELRIVNKLGQEMKIQPPTKKPGATSNQVNFKGPAASKATTQSGNNNKPKYSEKPSYQQPNTKPGNYSRSQSHYQSRGRRGRN